jgi:hypothetical protein
MIKDHEFYDKDIEGVVIASRKAMSIKIKPGAKTIMITETDFIAMAKHFNGQRKERIDMAKWIRVEDRLPPDNWTGLVVADVRPDRPVFAHVTGEQYRKECPYAGYFIGKWREALLTGDHMIDKAEVVLWLETDELYPRIPVIREKEKK